MKIKDFENLLDLDEYITDDMSEKEIYKEKKSIVVREVRKHLRVNYKRLWTGLHIFTFIILIPLVIISFFFEFLGAVGEKIEYFMVDFRNLIINNIAAIFYKRDHKSK